MLGREQCTQRAHALVQVLRCIVVVPKVVEKAPACALQFGGGEWLAAGGNELLQLMQYPALENLRQAM